MKKILQSLIILIAVAFSTQLNAQRYLTEIFDSYQFTEDVKFGVNVNPLISTFPDPAIPAELETWTAEMDFLNDLIDASITNPDTLLSYMNFFYPNSV